MKKYVAALAALAVAGTVGVYYVNEKMDTGSPDEQSTVSTSSYVQSDDSYTNNGVAVNDDVTADSSDKTDEPAKEYTFDAEIVSVSGDSVTLKVDSDSDLAKSANKVVVSLDSLKVVDSASKSVKADDVENFKNATVTYDGTVMETYPVQIKASEIVLRNRTDCNVYFCLDNGEIIDTVNVPVGSTIDSADMPNAGAYCEDGYHFEGWLLNGETVYGVEDLQSSISLTAKIRKD